MGSISSSRHSTGIARGLALPLHLQFRQLLLDQIERGELRAGEQLPREKELASRFGVSLAPVRQAILDLARDGYVYRVQGRGTFVREQTVEEKISILSSFTESMRAKGLEPDLRVLRQEVIATPGIAAAALRTRERSLLLLERLARVEREPVAILEAYLPLKLFPELRTLDLQGRSLYRTLAERFGVSMVRAESVIEVARCTPEQAAILQLSAGAPVLQVSGTTFDQAGRPVEFSVVRYRSDRFRFRLDSYRTTDEVIHVIDGRHPKGGRGGREGQARRTSKARSGAPTTRARAPRRER